MMLVMIKLLPHPSGPTRINGLSFANHPSIIFESLWALRVSTSGGLFTFFMSSIVIDKSLLSNMNGLNHDAFGS